MNYNADELFIFEKIPGGYTLARYHKWYDPSITELEIPEEYNGKPVVRIQYGAFRLAKNLKSVVLPKSLTAISSCVFERCIELEHVEFNSTPSIGLFAFGDCPKLPPETVAMGLVCSTDITQPVSEEDISDFIHSSAPRDLYRADVFELLAKNNCFREINPEPIFYQTICNNKPELFPIAEQYGMLENAELVDKLINFAVEWKNVELTAYLLELKKRKFGFAGFVEEDNFEL